MVGAGMDDDKQTKMDLSSTEELPQHILKLREVLETRWFQNTILAVIVLNAVSLGAETISPLMQEYSSLLYGLDLVFLGIFIVEISLRVYAYRRSFFKNGWNIFDFFIISLSVLALPNAFSAFRVFRVLRVLHLVTVMPRMRVVVNALLDSIPGIVSVGVVLVLILYVFAVIASNIYGPAHDELFGDVFTSMYTLFQVMTLEGWPDVAAAVRETHPSSWVFFVIFVLIATFTMLNLFVAIVVRVVEEDSDELEGIMGNEHELLREDIAEMRQEIIRLHDMLARMEGQFEVTVRMASVSDDKTVSSNTTIEDR